MPTRQHRGTTSTSPRAVKNDEQSRRMESMANRDQSTSAMNLSQNWISLHLRDRTEFGRPENQWVAIMLRWSMTLDGDFEIDSYSPSDRFRGSADSLGVHRVAVRRIALVRAQGDFDGLHVSSPSMLRPCGRYSRPGFSQTISPSLNTTTVRPSAAASRRTRWAARSKAASAPARSGSPGSPDDVRSQTLIVCPLRPATPGCCRHCRTASSRPPDRDTRSRNCAIPWKSAG